MEDKFVEISRLKNLVEQVLSLYEDKKQEALELAKEKESLQTAIQNKDNIIENLKKDNETLKTAKTISLSADDKAEVKNKINKIVREIDKSIGLLNE